MTPVLQESITVNVCVLGATGFIGQHLVERLISLGYAVSVLSRSEPDVARVRFPTKSVRWTVGDWNDPSKLTEAMAGADICFHLICTTLPRSSNEDPIHDVTSNVCGTIRVLEAALASGCRKVVFASSGGTIYGVPQSIPIAEFHPLEPNNSYGISKLAIEKYMKLFFNLHGLEYGIARLSNPYGEAQATDRAQGAVSVFLHRALTYKPIEIWGDGSIVRDYLYIADAVDGLIKVANYAGIERIFNIGSGRGLSLLEIVNEIETLLNRKVSVRHAAGNQFDVPINILSIDRAINALGFQPKVPFKAGLQRTAQWHQSYGRRAMEAISGD